MKHSNTLLRFVFLAFVGLSMSMVLTRPEVAARLGNAGVALERLQGWYAHLRSGTFIGEEVRDGKALAGDALAGASDAVISAANSLMSSLELTAQDGSVCARPKTQGRQDSTGLTVYQWTDDSGQRHMSDTAPEGVVASVRNVGPAKRDFQYHIESPGVLLPQTFNGKIAAASKRMYDTWHFFIGEENLRQTNIKLLLLPTQAAFDEYRGKYMQDTRPIAGFYTIASNEAVVHYLPDNLDATRSTAIHEVSHLITAGHLGPTPSWLTEGLAEYFENIDVRGQSGVVYPNGHHLALLRQTQLPTLAEFVAQSDTEWRGADRGLNYAISWSLVYFLMDGDPGMHALKDVVAQAHDNFCKPWSAADALAAAYPGGMARLEGDWQSWLAQSQHGAHQM
jgi:peptidase MA superfamily protein/uncharacterized protein DUF4124